MQGRPSALVEILIKGQQSLVNRWLWLLVLCRMDKGLRECMLIELSAHLGASDYYYIYPKESRDLAPYSESPVQTLQELNGVSRAETEPPKGYTGAYTKDSSCWSDSCCYSDACPRDILLYIDLDILHLQKKILQLLTPYLLQ
jgi:hypothetical protein